jgi:type IV secretion system protein VirB2
MEQEMQGITHKNLIALGYLVVLACLIFPDAAQAASGGGGLPYEGFLNQIRASLTGPVAFTLSIVGIVVGGATLIFGGDISGFFKLLITLVLVISILIGANNFMASFFGVGASIAQAPALSIAILA